MISLLIRLSFTLLVLNAFITPINAWDSYGSRERGYGTSGKDIRNLNEQKTIPKTKFIFSTQNSTRKGLGVSAWGIVIIVVALILAGMGLYYISMCYSICETNCQTSICQTKNKYDKMGKPTMA